MKTHDYFRQLFTALLGAMFFFVTLLPMVSIAAVKAISLNDELSVLHNEQTYVNTPVVFLLRTNKVDVRANVTLYVDERISGSINLMNNSAKLEMLFKVPGTRYLKFVMVDNEMGTSKVISSIINVLDPRATYRPSNGSIPYQSVPERQRTMNEEGSNNRNASSYSRSMLDNSFINSVIPIVKDYAESTSEPLPLSAIIGMAVLESAHGKSELATNANNFFGLKAWKKDPNSPDVYRYDRYPAEEGNLYKKFPNMEACIHFFIGEVVMHRTGKWQRDYSPILNRYQQEISQGVDKRVAIEHFLEGMGRNGYSTANPVEYKDKVMKIINTYQLAMLE